MSLRVFRVSGFLCSIFYVPMFICYEQSMFYILCSYVHMLWTIYVRFTRIHIWIWYTSGSQSIFGYAPVWYFWNSYVIFNTYIFKILLQFTSRKLKRAWSLSLNKPPPRKKILYASLNYYLAPPVKYAYHVRNYWSTLLHAAPSFFFISKFNEESMRSSTHRLLMLIWSGNTHRFLNFTTFTAFHKTNNF